VGHVVNMMFGMYILTSLSSIAFIIFGFGQV
jgi:hypothetical protein